MTTNKIKQETNTERAYFPEKTKQILGQNGRESTVDTLASYNPEENNHAGTNTEAC